MGDAGDELRLPVAMSSECPTRWMGDDCDGAVAGGDISAGTSIRSKLSSGCSPSVVVTIVSIVLALSVLVLIVVSDAVLEPMTTTFGTVRQLRLPPADLKLNRRIADERRSPSRPPPPPPLPLSAPCCPRDGCDCDVSP